jgi:hypothetical protein
MEPIWKPLAIASMATVAALLPSQLCYRIRGEEIVIGTLEELLR